jgi:hypothetical protein
MSNLGKTDTELRKFGRDLVMKYRTAAPSYAAVAQSIVTDLYHYLTDSHGKPLCALARTFRLCRHAELPPESQGVIKPDAGKYWLALMGTMGQEAAWHDRLQSKGHRIIAAGAFPSPMLKAAFEQMNLDPDHPSEPIAPDQDILLIENSMSFTRFFHVEKAPGSPYIVDQDTFVKPYGVQSVVGLGCSFLSGMFQFTLLFSKVTLTKDDARTLTNIAPHISTLLALYDEKGRLWN